MTGSIIPAICSSCSCNSGQAQEYLDDETGNLRELRDLGGLKYSDMETACDNLGLEHDYIEYFMNALAF
ncbi:hypothetical protein IR083_10495 [Dysgonomonas sp. GY75]|uniref:hypothetical protein n=1 Tax=Dysgonomonas sp. GY75 TaxID=2780419 RepID=UPI0018837706|nr:hypothetical protein [Dysgonomonas sp. GY75]MBF0649249.1 hypothetical protein [Dysgonomonas sp. GY75]